MKIRQQTDKFQTETASLAARLMKAGEDEITDICVLKKGMTNRSFVFSCRGRKYIIRIPGEGTDRLISRRQEYEVYRAVSGKSICDDIVYMDPENGYKITEYLQGARVCDPADREDVRRCMEHLRSFHGMGLRVGHEFDLFGQIDFYESLWDGMPSSYGDYGETKKNVLSLKPYIEAHADKKTLVHIDAVPDNFLFVDNGNGEEIRLIDWEYAGMQDPHVDIAMFCIYAMYDRQQADEVIRMYFGDSCPDGTRIKIYCYMAVCGLLWSNWCEYKRKLGVEFGEYSLRQYQYAKDFYGFVQKELGILP